MPNEHARNAFTGALVHVALGAGAFFAAMVVPGRAQSLVPIALASVAFPFFVFLTFLFDRFPETTGRRFASETAPAAILVFLHAGLFAALAGWVLDHDPLQRLGGIAIGTASVGLVLLVVASLRWGKPTGERGEIAGTWRIAIFASVAASLAGLTLSGSLLAFGKLPWGLATLTSMALAFAFPAIAAAVLASLGTEPPTRPRAAEGVGALVLAFAAGGLLLSGAALAAEPKVLDRSGSILTGIAGTALGVLAVFAPYRQGAISLASARPLFLAGGALLAAGGLALLAGTLAHAARPPAGVAAAFLFVALPLLALAAAVAGLPDRFSAQVKGGPYVALAAISGVSSAILLAIASGGLLQWTGAGLALLTGGIAMTVLAPLRT